MNSDSLKDDLKHQSISGRSKLQLKIQSYLILSILFFLPVYLIKIRFGWISSNVLELLIAALFIVWIFSKEKKYPATAGPRQGGGFISSTRYFVPILLIFAGLFLSVIANKNFYTGLGAIKGWFIFPLIFGIVFHDRLGKGNSLLKNSLLALFFSGAAVSAIGLIYKFLDNVTFDGRLRIFWDSPNQLAMFLAVPFLIGVCIFTPRISYRALPRFSHGLGVLLISTNLYLTKSYGAWLAISVAIVVIFWLKYRENKQRKIFAIILLLILIILTWASASKYNSIKISGNRSSLTSRMMIWKSAGRMIENNLLVGIGPDNFQNKYLEYQKYFPPYLEWSAPQPHNILLAFWLEAGLAGLAGFVLLLIQFFRDNKKAIQANREIGILLLGAMIYILVHGLVDTTYWRNDLAVVFWAIVAANIYLARKYSNSFYLQE